MALVNQDLVLDVVPGPIPPILYLTEYDENMEVVVTLMRRGQPFQIPTGTTAKIEGTLKGHPFSEDATSSGNTVTFMVSKNMTAYAGRAWTKIKLTKDSKPVSTCGFWLDCDRAGVEADTVISAPGFEEQIIDAVNDYLDEHGTGGDADALKQMLYLMLIPILKEGLYGTYQTNAIAALETALGAVPVVTQTVTNNLTNVTTSNDATVVVKGTAYTATLTPVGDAVIQTVTVMMKGVDVTASVYSNGTISIPSITGDIVITAVAESVIETYTPTMSEGYVNPTDGSIGNTSSYNHTQIIPVREGDRVFGSCFDTISSAGYSKIPPRFTAAYDSSNAIYPDGGNSDQAQYNQSSPFVVPSGVYGVVFSFTTRYTNIVVYVDKSERVGA